MSTTLCNSLDSCFCRQPSPNTGMFACDVQGCAFTAEKQSYLTAHKRGHAGARTHACQVLGCAALFLSASGLTTHALRHTGERPFVCTDPACDYTTTSKLLLTHHTRRHVGTYATSAWRRAVDTRAPRGLPCSSTRAQCTTLNLHRASISLACIEGSQRCESAGLGVLAIAYCVTRLLLLTLQRLCSAY